MKKPYITVKFAQTLDGKIAARDGSPLVISGKKALKFTHGLRARNNAILVGIGTVLTDNPLLTTRLVKGKDPVRIIIDARLRIPLDSKIIKTSRRVKTVIVAAPKASKVKIRKLKKKGAEVLLSPSKKGYIDLKKMAHKLRAKGIKSILVEGGREIIASFLKSGLADKIIIILSPRVLGSGIEALGAPKSAFKLRLISAKRLGNDLVITTRCRYTPGRCVTAVEEFSQKPLTHRPGV
jgi:riboflavin-specific deaminase-like protein